MTTHFSAPWSTKLKLTSWGVTGLLVAVSALDPVAAAVCYAVLAGSALFSVRGYSISNDELRIHRLGWATRISLQSVERAEFEPGAMRRSIRTFGNGGLFAFVGRFRNATLGAYRAYVTDAARCVVLELVDGTVVVTPDRPAAFVAAVEAAR